MKFTATALAGAFVVEPASNADERGHFARTFCQEEFERQGLAGRVVQCNVSFNRRRGTLRGMHLQAAPHAEAKLIRCTAGRVYDVIVDLRPDSPSFRRWHGMELSARDLRLLYVPEGVAHGFVTLEADSELFYQMSCAYHPESAMGVRWNDPAFGVRWPVRPEVISARDAGFADFGA
jgi:dTDP-4-dehydrorhamnose 3,5-epimerase